MNCSTSWSFNFNNDTLQTNIPGNADNKATCTWWSSLWLSKKTGNSEGCNEHLWAIKSFIISIGTQPCNLDLSVRSEKSDQYILWDWILLISVMFLRFLKESMFYVLGKIIKIGRFRTWMTQTWKIKKKHYAHINNLLIKGRLLEKFSLHKMSALGLGLGYQN